MNGYTASKWEVRYSTNQELCDSKTLFFFLLNHNYCIIYGSIMIHTHHTHMRAHTHIHTEEYMQVSDADMTSGIPYH